MLGIYVLYRFLVLRGRRPRFPGKASAKFLAPLGLFAGAVVAAGGGRWRDSLTVALRDHRIEKQRVLAQVDDLNRELEGDPSATNAG